MSEKNNLVKVRFGCSAGVLIFCSLLAFALYKTRPETETRPPLEPVLAVNIQEVEPTDLTVVITGQGVVRPFREVTVSSQVGGIVDHMPLEIRAGDPVKKDQILLKLEPVDYETAVSEAEAAAARLEAGLERLRLTEISEREQLKLARRSAELARKEFERARRLQQEGQAVSVAVVDNAERALNQAETQVVLLEQSLEQMPARRLEMESDLAAAKAGLQQRRVQLARTVIRAPFDARVKSVTVEQGEVVNPGMPLFVLADDTELEIEVPVTAADLTSWIAFSKDREGAKGWFPPLEKVPVTVRWPESGKEITWTGRLDRIRSFDATTRTAMLAVRVGKERMSEKENVFPLTEGMFCQVSIPGRTLEKVYELPRSAVTFDQRCFLAVEGRLKTVEVTVARYQEDSVYVSGGLQSGDRVITTRLVAPKEGSRVQDIGEN